MVYIEGAIETRKWQDQSGADRYSTEIVIRPYAGTLSGLADFGDGERGERRGGGSYDDRDRGGGGDQQQSSGSSRSGGGYGGGARSDIDDEIPFAPEWRG